MIVLFALIGLLIGWLLSWASAYLTRFSSSYQPSPPVDPGPPPLALWQLVVFRFSWKTLMQRQKWFGLHLSVEFLTAVFFAYLYLGGQTELSWRLFFFAGSYVFFLLIAIIDLKYRLVLNVFTYPATILILIVHFLLLRQDTLGVLLGGGLAFSIFFLTAWLRPGDLGGGDVKLATFLGFAFGFPQVLWVLLIGAGAGAIASIYLLLLRRRGLKTYIPYAPFLCFGAMMVLLV